MKNMLMLNDILWDGEHIGRVIALSEKEFIVKSENGEWNGNDTRPLPLYVHELQHILRNFNMIEL